MPGVSRALRVGSFAAVWNGFTRMAILTLGGILVLQSSDVLDLPKLIYLVLAVAVVASAAWRVRGLSGTLAFGAMRGLLVAMIGLLAVIAISLPVAAAHGVAAPAWLRDAASYGLFAIAPLVALDAHDQVDRRWILALILVVGGTATVSYTLAWLDLRSIFAGPVERLVLPSGALASMFFVVTTSYSFRASRHRHLWALAAGVTLGLFLIIGTRGRLPFVLLPVVLGILSGGGMRATLQRWAVQYAAAAAVVLAVPILQGLSVSPSTTPAEQPTEVLGRRLGSVDDLVTDPGGDASMRERISQTVGAWNVFTVSPILGAGPGLEVGWIDYAGEPQRGYALDSPLMLLAKFGIGGLVVAMLWLLAFGRFVKDVPRRVRGSPEWLVLSGEIVVLAYASLFSPPMQDKGTAFALMMVLALLASRTYATVKGLVTARPGDASSTGAEVTTLR